MKNVKRMEYSLLQINEWFCGEMATSKWDRSEGTYAIASEDCNRVGIVHDFLSYWNTSADEYKFGDLLGEDSASFPILFFRSNSNPLRASSEKAGVELLNQTIAHHRYVFIGQYYPIPDIR